MIWRDCWQQRGVLNIQAKYRKDNLLPAFINFFLFTLLLYYQYSSRVPLPFMFVYIIRFLKNFKFLLLVLHNNWIILCYVQNFIMLLRQFPFLFCVLNGIGLDVTVVRNWSKNFFFNIFSKNLKNVSYCHPLGIFKKAVILLFTNDFKLKLDPLCRSSSTT